jgi:ABC-type branched-subunit amino acid transport system substrate-binding protein
MRNRHQWSGVVAMFAALALLAVGCGDDDDDVSAAGAAETADATEVSTEDTEATGGDAETSASDAATTAPQEQAATFTGDPVSIGIIVPFDTAEANFPESVDAARSAVDALNTRGGIAGHEVELRVCNERNDPNEAVACANEMVDDGVIAVVASFTRSAGGQIAQIMSDNGIPYIGAAVLSAEDTSVPTAFAIEASILNFTACGNLLAESEEVTDEGMLRFDVDASALTEQFTRAGATAAGATWAGTVAIDPATSDYAPSMASIMDTGATGITFSLTEQASVLALQAAQQAGYEGSFCHVSAALSPDSLRAAGEIADGFNFASGTPPLGATDEFPILEEFAAELDAGAGQGYEYAEPELRKGSSLNAWISVRIVEQVGNTVTGELTAASLLDALNGASAVDTGITVMDFSEPNAVPGFERLFNSEAFHVQWSAADDALVLASPEPIDTLELFLAGQSG